MVSPISVCVILPVTGLIPTINLMLIGTLEGFLSKPTYPTDLSNIGIRISDRTKAPYESSLMSPCFHFRRDRHRPISIRGGSLNPDSATIGQRSNSSSPTTMLTSRSGATGPLSWLKLTLRPNNYLLVLTCSPGSPSISTRQNRILQPSAFAVRLRDLQRGPAGILRNRQLDLVPAVQGGGLSKRWR